KVTCGVSALPGGRLAACLYSRDSIVAFDGANGLPCWSHRFERPGELLPVEVIDGALFAACGQVLQAIDAATGRIHWETSMDSPVERVIATAGAVLASTERGGIAAFHPQSGGQLWRQDLSGSRLWAVSGRHVIVSSNPSQSRAKMDTILTLDLASGNEQWRIQSGTTAARLSADNGRLYFLGWNNRLDVFHLENGRQIWALEGVPAEADSYWTNEEINLVFCDERLLAVDPGNGAPQWQIQAGEYEVLSVMIDAQADAIYIGTDEGRVASLDLLTGTERWSLSLPSRSVENIFVDADNNVEKVVETVNADVSQVIPDGKGRLFVVAEGMLFAVG
ncbi:PQQ-binding-like beta-propeller repeat protein, partial [Acidobacteriota bacterium]